MNGSHGQHTMPFASIIEAPDAVDISSPSILFLWSFHWHDKLSYACTWEVCEPSVWCYWSWCHSSWSLKNVPLFLNVPSLTCKIDLYRAIFHILYSLWLLVDNWQMIFIVSLFIEVWESGTVFYLPYGTVFYSPSAYNTEYKTPSSFMLHVIDRSLSFCLWKPFLKILELVHWYWT